MLTQLTDQERGEISRYFEERVVRRGEVLFSPADVAQGVYFVKSGRLGVQTETGFEDKKQMVALLETGSAIGERGLAEQAPRGMTVVAVNDSILWHLPVEAFAEIERSNPHLALKILKKLLSVSALRLRVNSQRLAHVL